MKTYALLTGGPSIREHWRDELYDRFDEVWAVNMIGKEFRHHWCCHLDTPFRIFREKGRKRWDTTTSGVYSGKLTREQGWRSDPDCTISFPYFLWQMLHTAPLDARIKIYGWDCAGRGAVDRKCWDRKRDAKERRLVARYWDRDRIAGVYGGMREWAEENLGFAENPNHAPAAVA